MEIDLSWCNDAQPTCATLEHQAPEVIGSISENLDATLEVKEAGLGVKRLFFYHGDLVACCFCVPILIFRHTRTHIYSVC